MRRGTESFMRSEDGLITQPPTTAKAPSTSSKEMIVSVFDWVSGGRDRGGSGRGVGLRVARVRHYWQWLVAVVVVVSVGWFVSTVARSRNVDWSTFGRYAFNDRILHGVVVTVEITAAAFAAGCVCGLVLAVFRLSSNPVLRTLAALYVWFFRAMPLILLIFLLGNLALLFPRLQIKIPVIDVTVVSASTNAVVTVFVASVIAITLHDAAPTSEIIRSSIQGVHYGQTEAGKALGLTSGQTMRKVVLPQALRTMIPPLANQFVFVLKQTSVVSVIAGGDVMTEAANIYAVNFRTVELLFVAAFWYLLLVSVATVGQRYLEDRVNRGVRR